MDLKKIPIARLSERDMSIEQLCSASEILNEQDASTFNGSLKLSGIVYKVDDAILADLTITAERIETCSRCLANFAEGWRKKLKFDFPLGEVDGYLNLVPDIRQEIEVDEPIAVTCSKECKGLCCHCGINLNTNKCNCETQ